MLKSLPNILTISRIVLLPVILMLIYYSGESSRMHQISAWFFAYACATDFLDGYLARSYKWQSKFGALMDPIADKLLVCSVIMILLYQNKTDLIPSVAIICREILVSGLREFLSTVKVSLPVSRLGKVKTFVQMFSIFLLVLGSTGGNINFIDNLGNIMLWLAAVLTIFTGYFYVRQGFKYLNEES